VGAAAEDLLELLRRDGAVGGAARRGSCDNGRR
jgi:hypothetical protein